MKKFFGWGLVLALIYFIISFLWSVVGDVLLGPTKDLIDSKVSNFLQSRPPGYNWYYVAPIILFIGCIVVGVLYVRQKIANDLPPNSDVDIKKFMKKFTDKTCRKQYVIATQLYRYKFRKSNCKIKVTYQDGYVVEDEKLNAVLQDYFEIDRALLNQLKNGIEEAQKNNNFAKLDDFLLDCLQDLNASPTIQNVNKEVTQFSLFVLGVQYLLKEQNGASDFLGPNRIVRILAHRTKEEELYTLSRAGLMRSILNTELSLSSLYCFEHIGNGDKAGRVYLTLNVLRKDEPDPYLFLITVSPKVEEEQNQTQILSEILKEFVDQIENELDIEEIQSLRLVV
ncbi:hypothetical protein [Priestia megaterium]